ncbi:helix-turn-helix domain-containing protein [Spirillospora sp. NPDC052269]
MIDGSCHTFVSDCHVRAAAELINHTWDPIVLSALRLGPTRRNELLGRIAGASDKVLTQALQRLLAHGLITKERAADPVSANSGVVYRLSPLGESFTNGPLVQLAQWAADNQAELADSSTTS